MAKITQATAKVKLELEIYVDAKWGDDCTLKQVYKQATDAAIRKISKELKGRFSEFNLIGKPVIYTVLLPPKK